MVVTRMSAQGSLFDAPTAPRGRPTMDELYPEGYGADLSEDGRFRWALWRNWAKGPHALFAALNPSIADGMQDDATIKKEVEFCKRWGLATLRKVNTSPLVSTDPTLLLMPGDYTRKVAEATNLDVIHAELRRPGLQLVVVAWGAFPEALDRGRVIVQMVRDAGHLPMCLGTTKDGHPKHPCRLAYATPLVRYEAPT